jgi:predicted O-methyltransferase YrrM
LTPLNWDLIDRALYERALATEGFFSPGEGELLMRVLQAAGPGCRAFEVGSYRGRSALFSLAALPADGRLIGVDAFIDAAGYAGHSARALVSHVGDERFTVLEGTLANAWHAVAAEPCDVALVDADHSFAGASADLALAAALLRSGGTLLVHDVAGWFPGVVAAVGALAGAGVLAELERVESLCALEVVSRPRWLTDPAVDRGGELPSPVDSDATPISARR